MISSLCVWARDSAGGTRNRITTGERLFTHGFMISSLPRRGRRPQRTPGDGVKEITKPASVASNPRLASAVLCSPVMTNGFHVLIFFEAKLGKAEALGRVLVDLITPSRTEPGCRFYEPFEDTENPGRFTVIEAWDTQEQWHRHLQTPHVAKALAEVNSQDILTQPFTAQQLRSIG
jgi:quinol monooxygenase YgiN